MGTTIPFAQVVPLSTVNAGVVGFLAGFFLGAAFGVWLGLHIGYKPSVSKYIAAAFLVAGTTVVVFAGWHRCAMDRWPTFSDLRPPFPAEMKDGCKFAGGAGFALVSLLFSGSRIGTRLKEEENRRQIAEVDNVRLGEEAKRLRQNEERLRQKEELLRLNGEICKGTLPGGSPCDQRRRRWRWPPWKTPTMCHDHKDQEPR